MAGGRITGRFELGYDSFSERYTILDADTLDRVNEWRSRLHLGWSRGRILRNYFQVETRALLGQDDSETALALRATRRLPGRPGSRLSVDVDLLRRAFGQNTTLQFPNDYDRFHALTYARIAVAPSVAVRIADRVEVLDYQRRTEFDYDYTRHQVSAAVYYDRSFATTLSGGVRRTSLSIPDSSEIEYTAWTPFVELRTMPSLNHIAWVSAAMERRLYRPEGTRNSYWNILATGGIEWNVRDPMGVVVENRVDWYNYDSETGVYFDSMENRTIVLARYAPTERLRAGLGGAWGRFRSAQSRDDEYNERGAMVRIHYTPSPAAWFDVEYERGRRRYPAYSPDASIDAESVFSDYDYDRVSVLAGWRFLDGLSLNLFVDYQPEDHEREGDDATATLFSANLSWTF